MKARSILFVCTGNICRSPMAEYLLRHMLKQEGRLHIEVFSRGVFAEVHEPMTRESVEALKQVGISGNGHSAEMLSADDVTRAHQIFAMTQEHMDIVLERYPNARGKVQRLAGHDIADPYGRSLTVYEKCRIEIQNALLDIILKLKSEGSPTP